MGFSGIFQDLKMDERITTIGIIDEFLDMDRENDSRHDMVTERIRCIHCSHNPHLPLKIENQKVD